MIVNTTPDGQGTDSTVRLYLEHIQRQFYLFTSWLGLHSKVLLVLVFTKLLSSPAYAVVPTKTEPLFLMTNSWRSWKCDSSLSVAFACTVVMFSVGLWYKLTLSQNWLYLQQGTIYLVCSSLYNKCVSSLFLYSQAIGTKMQVGVLLGSFNHQIDCFSACLFNLHQKPSI